MKRKTLLTGIILILNTSSILRAQSIGIGGSINHTTNGINLYHSSSDTKNKWNFDIGLRITVNTYSLNENRQNFIFYQTGYANSFWEHFGLNLRISRKAVSYKWIRLDAMANLFLTYQSLLIKNNTIDHNTGYITITVVYYWKPAPAIEFTIGPLLQVDVSHKITVTGTVGFGIAYFLYQYESGWDRTTNRPTGWLRNGKKPNKDRGDHDFVGLDGLPMLSLGVKYKLTFKE